MIEYMSQSRVLFEETFVLISGRHSHRYKKLLIVFTDYNKYLKDIERRMIEYTHFSLSS